MITYPISFLNAGGEYHEAIGRLYRHHSVMDKYMSGTVKSLEIRQAKDYVEFLIEYRPLDTRRPGRYVDCSVRVSIYELSWAISRMAQSDISAWNGFECVESSAVLDIETGLADGTLITIEPRDGCDEEDFLSVTLTEEDWSTLLDLLRAMIEDHNEYLDTFVDITGHVAAWEPVVSSLRRDGLWEEANAVEAALSDNSTQNGSEVTISLSSRCLDVEAVKFALHPASEYTYDEWLEIAKEVSAMHEFSTAAQIHENLADEEYGRNHSTLIEMRFPYFASQCIKLAEFRAAALGKIGFVKETATMSYGVG